MFRRRLAVLGTAAVLALTGLGGSAMADEAPTGDAPAAAITCTTSDGHDIKLAEPVKGKVIVTRDADGVSALPEGEPGKIMMKAMPATPATPGSPTSSDTAPTAPTSP
ncbi:MAG: hypothetical protein HOY71_47510, partial [Nonomuraea sp.]|nr:hypothetical protein [Nonomuraea sp.]